MMNDAVVAVLANETVPVAIHGVSGGSLGIIVTILLSTIGTVSLGYFKIWPKLREQSMSSRRADMEAAAADQNSRIADLLERVTKLEAQVADATAHANAADERTNVMKLKMVSLNAAFQLVAGEMRRTDPENAVLKQALDLIAMAATEDMGISRAMSELARLPGTRSDI